MLDPKALEAAARALAMQARVSEMEARGYNGNHASEYADEWWRSHMDRARHCLTAYLAAMREQGFAMMPREPTEAMRSAGMVDARGIWPAKGMYALTAWPRMFDAHLGDA